MADNARVQIKSVAPGVTALVSGVVISSSDGATDSVTDGATDNIIDDCIHTSLAATLWWINKHDNKQQLGCW